MIPKTHLNNSLFFLAILLTSLSFTDLAIAIDQHPQGFAWEKSLLLSIHQTANLNLNFLAIKLTGLGTYWGVAPILTISLLIFALKKYWYGFAYLLVTMAGGWAISYNLKIVFHRNRPQFWTLFYPLPDDFAFPSGHALFSSLLVVSLLILSWRTRWFFGVVLLGIPLVLVIAWTRLYLGVHFPSDILAAWLLAIAWSLLVHLWWRQLLETPKAINTQEETNN
ncbi:MULTISPECIES: phosphatase PAP2 family protein [Microcystis]|uniref:Phosphoesterase PA-phosphatase n=1 Tax=Microcystis panniformis FACHB-1757 TaxID=1638788 RepID=A0A0K1RY55_9CHRO|nr:MULTISPECIES: phosphatase PAP2 family protein [Microcystis]AKV66824.1 phosphoesterase PA-phosphatase [Microcystis panniformis FACHB-1757]TRT79851.1 MAG: phosphatase PAP2 family protein [Microcystis sp. M_OC_Ca_00000000_S217Cul]TRT86938.1 MAG: phosphatase PAP2 family protein [Microcystis sp. M_OC_Ca_00000000_C217Col]